MSSSEMKTSNSQFEDNDKETKDLLGLLDVFVSVCSLQEIASAYSSSNGNVDDAADILIELQNSRSGNYTHEGEALHVKDEKLLSDSGSFLGSKRLTVSTGIVPNALGRDYALSSRNRFRTTKDDGSLKPEVKHMCTSEMPLEHPAKSKPLDNKDIENFLFSMLHDGFNLDGEKTQHILRSCGYDVKKSMEGLMELSSFNSAEGNDSDGVTISTENCGREPCCSGDGHTELTGSPRGVKDSCPVEQSSVPMAVLEALYSNANIAREKPKRTMLELGLNRKRVPKEKIASVIAPSADTIVKPMEFKESVETKNDEDRYKSLREAAKSHWDMMKTYYEAAFDAFIAGDHQKANYLVDMGKHHNRLAREADETSAREITETRNTGEKDTFTLDLHMHHAKEAVTLLKQHLRSLAGIPSFSHLKVIVDSDDVGPTKGRRKQAVIKILEKRSIVWSAEDGKPGTILIKLDLLDRQKLKST